MKGIERNSPWFWHARIRLFMEVNHLEPVKHIGKHHISRYLEGMFFLAIKGCSKWLQITEISGDIRIREIRETYLEYTLFQVFFCVFFGALVSFYDVYMFASYRQCAVYIYIQIPLLLCILYRYTSSLAKMFFFVNQPHLKKGSNLSW